MRDRTADLMDANHALSQLSYSPERAKISIIEKCGQGADQSFFCFGKKMLRRLLLDLKKTNKKKPCQNDRALVGAVTKTRTWDLILIRDAL